MRLPIRFALVAAAWLTAQPEARAWDYEVHRVINKLALSSLPTNFPAFVREPENAERIAFLSGEPDRWRNTPDLALKHVNHPDHYIDIEDLEVHGLSPEQLPALRYDFVARLAVVREAQPEVSAHLTPENNADHTKELCGLLPWTITEYYSRLKSAWSYFNAFQNSGGTETELANAQANIVYLMGVMGHFVGDATQPLHTTKHFNGWVGDNPGGYTTNRGFHAWIDSGFFHQTGMPRVETLKNDLRPARPVMLEGAEVPAPEMFRAVMRFIAEQHALVEPLYQLDQAGSLHPGSPTEEQGRAFLQQRLLAAGQRLGDLWVNAWQQAPEDAYLKRKLLERADTPTPQEP